MATIFLVEDNPAEQLSIRELLGHDDIDVKIASTGAEALETMTDEAFDCVVLDLKLAAAVFRIVVVQRVVDNHDVVAAADVGRIASN